MIIFFKKIQNVARSTIDRWNAKIHKTYRTRELIEASGAEVLFLPPYPPDYNPIEHDFANIKRLREYNADKTIDEIINMYH